MVRGLKFAHLTTDDGLSQGYVVAILQDRRGFMWFATRDGLNRYEGNAFVVYKNNPTDSGSLSSNFLQDLMQDHHGYLWIATNTGVNKFDPETERCTRYLHEPDHSNSLGGTSVKSIVQDSRGSLWFGTEDSGLDKLDPTTGTFTHFRNDSDGQFIGRISRVIEDRHREIWFVGERGLFHLNQPIGHITRPPATRNGLSANSVYEDETGSLWMLVDSPVVGLAKYDREAERLTTYPLGARDAGFLASTSSGGSLNGTLRRTGRMDYGCHPARVSITSIGKQNVSRTGFSTRKATRPASTATRFSLSIGIEAVCCGQELRMRDSTSSIFGNSSSTLTGIVPPTPIVSPQAGSRRFIRILMAFCGWACFRAPRSVGS